MHGCFEFGVEGEVSERQQPEKQMSIDQVCYNYTDLSEFLPLLPGVEEMALAETCASLCVSFQWTNPKSLE